MSQNPVLRGFCPDPSILRVGSDYYIATSTFEWFPGVRLHHSRDLIHWRIAGHALTRRSQLDLRGNPNSCGVWAPDLSHYGGQFWLIFTDVKVNASGFTDSNNYLVTAPSIEGPWSEPVFLNATGFDPSLFHDADGRKWLLQMERDFRPGRVSFAGIIMQEFDSARSTLIGPIHRLFTGSALGYSEGPHIYRHGGYYYLLTAEGGTSYGHACTLARSRALTGPYEIDPAGSFLTTRDSLASPLQRVGHGSLVQTPSGEWFVTFLCARPWAPHRRSVFGRETAITPVKWTKEGWLRLPDGGQVPALVFSAADFPPEHPWPRLSSRDDFGGSALQNVYFTLRDAPAGDWLDLNTRPGWLRLRGRESPVSFHHQSLVARPLREFNCRIETMLEFNPVNYRQMAGLIVVREQAEQLLLHVSRADNGTRIASLYRLRQAVLTEVTPPHPLPSTGQIRLRLQLADRHFIASYATEASDWRQIGPAIDASEFSDEVCFLGRHTGTLVGLFACDLERHLAWAEFDYFDFDEATPI